MTPAFARDLVALLPRLRRFAMSLTGSAHEADDLVQAACERAIKAHESWEPGTRMDAWLFRIAKNLWIDQIRRRKVEGPGLPLEDAPDITGMDGAAVADLRLDMADVARAIEALPADQQAVLTLICVEDLSYREAAERLDIPIGTVMSRLARARTALARHLDRTPDKPPDDRTGS
jgi:RNA polymerase sigma-70 factor, ECF subfamily